MDGYFVTISQSSEILGISERTVKRYLASGKLTEDHRERAGAKGMVMIKLEDVIKLREERKKRGK